MAFSQWTFSIETSPSLTASLTSTTPLEESSSVIITAVDDVSKWAFGYTPGLVKDCVYVKALFKTVSGGNTWNSLGIFAQSQGAFSTAANAYSMTIHNGLFGAAGPIVLHKGTLSAALQDNTGVSNATITIPASNVCVAMGLKCEHDTTSGNMFLTALFDPGPISIPVGSTYAFPGLASQCTYLDTASPYVTGVTFGIFGRNAAGATLTQKFDLIVVNTD
jgi:hypothetical protein